MILLKSEWLKELGAVSLYQVVKRSIYDRKLLFEAGHTCHLARP